MNSTRIVATLVLFAPVLAHAQAGAPPVGKATPPQAVAPAPAPAPAAGPAAHAAPPAGAPAAPVAPGAFEGQLAGNGTHACFLRPTHDVVCWGLDLQNVHVPSPSGEPRLVNGLTDAQEIAVGVAHACAIRAGGQVVCWGYNGLGQLGAAPERIFHVDPQPVAGIADAVHIASGANRTCAARASGGVACWGSWDPFVARDPEVAIVPNLANVTALTMSDTHVCALQSNGHAACWGDDLRGECGNGRAEKTSFTVEAPEPVVGLEDAVQIAAAHTDTCALRKSGQVVCWGERTGQFAPADKRAGSKFAVVPTEIPGATGAKAVLLTDKTGCLLRAKDNQLACWWPLTEPWNQNDFAKQHFTGTKLTEVKLPALAKSTRQLLHAEESYALVAGGRVLHWGGRGARLAATPVKGIADAVAVSTGAAQSCAVRSNGTVTCWGAIGTGLESSGIMATLTSKFSPMPITVPKVTNAVAVSTGAAHACALDKSGGVTCWGHNGMGQLGNGKKGATLSAAARAKAKVSSPTPPPDLLPREAASKVKLPARAVQVSAGGDSTCAVLQTGALACWGANNHGQLGTTGPASLSPALIPGIVDAARVSVGDASACAVRKDGSVVCWGRDQLALTGDGNAAVDLRAPTPVPGVAGAVDVAVAEGAVCATLKDGTAHCWGHRSRFLGDDDPQVRGGASVAVKDVTDAAALAVGPEQRCVRHASGTVSCWGHNFWGAIGDGTRVDRLAPVDVVGLGAVQAISAGTEQTCALRGGQVVCWGAYTSGGLGDGMDASAPRDLAIVPTTTPALPLPAPAPGTTAVAPEPVWQQPQGAPPVTHANAPGHN
ncbi:MAG: hypothetical protein JST54_11925 [Deltaproteobacteria bacterium]|nr:hypothetical protein [Deltaproteobacteria bacterium]